LERADYKRQARAVAASRQNPYRLQSTANVSTGSTHRNSVQSSSGLDVCAEEVSVSKRFIFQSDEYVPRVWNDTVGRSKRVGFVKRRGWISTTTTTTVKEQRSRRIVYATSYARVCVRLKAMGLVTMLTPSKGAGGGGSVTIRADKDRVREISEFSSELLLLLLLLLYNVPAAVGSRPTSGSGLISRLNTIKTVGRLLLMFVPF